MANSSSIPLQPVFFTPPAASRGVVPNSTHVRGHAYALAVEVVGLNRSCRNADFSKGGGGGGGGERAQHLELPQETSTSTRVIDRTSTSIGARYCADDSRALQLTRSSFELRVSAA
ncbi:hypothetical protein M378DRAFT_13453 [Amanita muscaria Koide BX008]|uniref:Uncharacterized protein n=1 Tax=Amanita muscaria (strain Koide BX008) TaxID=946122 RepID=A0A0C2SER8_AMAMK|nr:hypothetical protein M378DRAFT_13453 [Amanita muscaria Koide BX008]